MSHAVDNSYVSPRISLVFKGLGTDYQPFNASLAPGLQSVHRLRQLSYLSQGIFRYAQLSPNIEAKTSFIVYKLVP